MDEEERPAPVPPAPVHRIEVPPSIVAPFPTPAIRPDVAAWLASNARAEWRITHEGPPWADFSLAFADQGNAALFRLSWL